MLQSPTLYHCVMSQYSYLNPDYFGHYSRAQVDFGLMNDANDDFDFGFVAAAKLVLLGVPFAIVCQPTSVKSTKKEFHLINLLFLYKSTAACMYSN